ncbi:MAG: AAA family ATPase [Nitrospirae bacterium]|nr:AAA family ATPase [Nitrospirota bacterium]
MILVDSITIKEFRGIRELTLEFKQKNFAICGPNGTGKSGVVDALEFALTGNVSRLSGEGKGEVSLKQHAPHVDMRDNPDKARVTVKVTIPKLNKTVTVERSLKNPAVAQVTPNDADVIEILDQVKSHPEIALSRREIIRYVLATPGKRAEEVQALLHLDQVERVRVVLQKVANSCEKQLAPLATAVTQARENLLRATGISDVKTERLLAEANTQRTIIGLPALVDLTDSTSLKDGMATPSLAQPQHIPKAQALADIGAARQTLTEITSASTTASAAQALDALNALASDPAISASVERESFYVIGMEMIEAAACPFCDIAWDLVDLKKHIQAKLDHLRAISDKRKKIEKMIAPLITSLRKAHSAMNNLTGHAATATPPVVIEEVISYGTSCRTAIDKLTSFLPVNETITALNSMLMVPTGAFEAIDRLDQVVAALPEPTKQDAARDWLSVAQERLEFWRDATRKNKAATEQAQRARQVSDIYATTSDKVLAGIYEAVEKDFASLYRYVNREDENTFNAQLVPSMGKLGFGVDFYGRGFFPPGAYHSEGHQDSMGLCLYLALMRHLQGTGFTLAVLDDILMSVDAGHRREVCALLKKEFPNTQFIMTTHDPIWLRHMKTEGIIDGRSALQFRNWSVDQGPTRWDARDVWKEIEDYLNNNDVRGAASLLRHYLEYESAELCHRLRAPVEFRGDAQYQLGELLPAAIKRMRTLFARMKESANSWNQQELVDQLAARDTKFIKLATSSNAEQWQVNVAVHYNSWDNLCKKDFEPVVEAVRQLLSAFTCSDCDEYLRVSPDRETPESIRCECGKTTFNLQKKVP